MMDGSDPEGEPVGSIPKIVTLGGGHGQSAVLAALRQIRCRLTAVISVADDGGCSGRLRSEIGMPPPGDLRRCLLAIAQEHDIDFRIILKDEHDLSGANLSPKALQSSQLPRWSTLRRSR